jgi:hypothetical protein
VIDFGRPAGMYRHRIVMRSGYNKQFFKSRDPVQSEWKILFMSSSFSDLCGIDNHTQSDISFQ